MIRVFGNMTSCLTLDAPPMASPPPTARLGGGDLAGGWQGAGPQRFGWSWQGLIVRAWDQGTAQILKDDHAIE